MRFLLACLAFALVAANAGAQSSDVPYIIPHVGRLLAANDARVDATMRMKFTIHTTSGVDPEATDRVKWTQVFDAVKVTNGIYTVELGKGEESPITDAVFDGGARWLEVEVDGSKMSPRIRIGSAAFALAAKRADKAGDADKLNGKDAAYYLDAANLDGTLGADVTYKGAPIEDAQIKSAAKWNAMLESLNTAAPLSGNGTTTAPLTISAASATQDGFLKKEDFAAFNAKTGAPASATQDGYLKKEDFAAFLTKTGAADTYQPKGDYVVAGGGVKLPNPTPCATSDKGSLRYSTAGRVEVCDGSAWVGLGARDTSPDGLSFAALTGQVVGTPATSAPVTISGVEGEIIVSVVGDGPTRLKVNNGAEVASARAKNGDTITLVMKSDQLAGVKVASVTAGDVVAQWSVTYAGAAATCKALFDAGQSANGTYKIDTDGPGGADPFDAWCDMSNGGWTYRSNGVPFKLTNTSGVQTLTTTAATATYRFVAMGAQGGAGQNLSGGKGGRVEGTKTFGARTPLFVFVGGQGQAGGGADQGSCNTRTGGYNGGGRGSQGGSGGGGGTDVRTSQTDPASRILVAGGGGGCGYDACGRFGGDGGGINGGNSQAGSGTGQGGSATTGGTPSSGNASGKGSLVTGGDNVQCNDEGGGGGGYYGGSSGGTDNTGGGGGSSYYGGLDTGATTTTGVNTGDGYLEYIFK